jgi:bifunctional non-homologous end joining protein LigD
VAGVELSRLDKVFWPEEGLTKGDLIAYLDAVAPAMLRYLRGRPLTVKRYPDGVAGQAFYQKNTPRYAPAFVDRISLRADTADRDVDYTLANDRRTLVWLGNQAVVEFHPFLSRVDALDRPEMLLFDIDPPEGRFDLAARTAVLTREVLTGHGLRAAVKTSGAKGVHVVVPLVRRYGYAEAARAAYRLAEEAAAREPSEVTVEFLKAQRGGRVFLDWTRIGLGKHVVAPYSPRARPGAPVSFPVPWERLERGRADPLEHTIVTVPRAMDRSADPWGAALPAKQSLPKDLTAE